MKPSRRQRFLGGMGFLDAMLTSFAVLAVVIAAITVLYAMYAGRF